jgi:BlaI family penicillinase repressor
MQLCWKLGRATARQVFDHADGTRDYRTIKTFLDRIAAKGYLDIEKLGRLSLYVPAVTRRRALAEAVRDFVDDILESSVTPLYVHLAERDDLTEEEIAFFRAQLEEEGEKKGKR